MHTKLFAVVALFFVGWAQGAPVPVPGVEGPTLSSVWIDAERADVAIGDGEARTSSDTARIAFSTDDAGRTRLTIDGDDGVHQIELRFTVRGDHSYYGFGERFNAIDQHGSILPMSSTDQPGIKGTSTYKPIPLLMCHRGWGFFVNNGAAGRFDVCSTSRYEIRVSYPVSDLEVVFFTGTLPEMLDSYTALTGRPRVPPMWAFGVWKSRDVHRSGAEVLEDAELMRLHDIPGSVINVDSPWATCYNSFEINRVQFADPEAVFARTRELGFRTSFWLTPFINTRNVTDMAGIDPGPCDSFAEAAEAGYLVKRPDGEPYIASWWKGEGGLVDFTNPAAVEWWQGRVRRVFQWNAAAFKADDAEGTFIEDAVFYDGTPAHQMKSLYALRYREALQQLIDEELGGDGVMIGRSGFAGTQRTPFGWAGDNLNTFSMDNGLPTVILASQNAGMSGLPFWTSDIAGYFGGKPTKEVFVRWTQFGAFSPLMLVLMQNNLGPWDFDDETLRIFRDYARLHTQLVPYIYEAAIEASETGMPIMRGMPVAFPDQRGMHSARYQYMFGPDLLVAPMYRPGTSREVRLPAGAWTDFWSGETHAGPATLMAHAPLEHIPLYVRAGAVLPMLPPEIDTLIPRYEGLSDSVVALDDRRHVQIWPGAAREFETHDGLRVVTERGEDGRTRATITSRTPRSVTVEVRGVHPTRIEADGARLLTQGGVAGAVLEVDAGRRPIVLMWKDPTR